MGGYDPLKVVTADEMTNGYASIPVGTPSEDGPVERKAKVRAGGEYGVGKKIYWFPADLYDEVEERDNNTPLTKKGDREFETWIKEFIKEHASEVHEVKRAQYKRQASAWATPYTTYSYHYGGKSGTDPKTARRATILRAMRTVLSVTDPLHKLTVKYTDDMTSGWRTDQVVLPEKPASDIEDLEEAINVEGGFAIHEAWHSIYSRPAITKDCLFWFAEDMWAKTLFNIADDVRIEVNGLRVTPGVRQYLNYCGEYLWDDKVELPKAWSWEPEKIEDRVRAMFMWWRETDRADEMLTDPSFEKPREWLENYIIKYVGTLNSETKYEVMRPLIEELKTWLKVPPPEATGGKPSKGIMIITPCGYNDHDKGIEPEDAEAVADAIEAEVEAVDARDWAKTFGEPKKAHTYKHWYDDSADMKSCIILKPRIDNPRLYVPSKGGLVEKAKNSLALKKTLAQNDTRLMKSGELDEDELYRLMHGDMRIFKDATVETLPNAAVTLLVDMSGSMGNARDEGNSAYYATRIAQLFVEGLANKSNVKLRVLGHSGDSTDNEEGGAFYRIWEPGDNINRLSLLYEQHRYANNFDGFAIAWAGQMLKQDIADQHLLIVLSDGQPHGRGYMGEAARNHVREVTNRLDRQGINVVQVAVGSGISSHIQHEMFKHFIELRDGGGGDPFATVFRKLTRLLEKFVR